MCVLLCVFTACVLGEGVECLRGWMVIIYYCWKGVQLGPEWYVFFLFFFFSEVLVMDQGMRSGN